MIVHELLEGGHFAGEVALAFVLFGEEVSGQVVDQLELKS